MREFLAYFLRLGAFGSGGRLAGYMQRDLVEQRRCGRARRLSPLLLSGVIGVLVKYGVGP